jgi:hypothetical protein
MALANDAACVSSMASPGSHDGVTSTGPVPPVPPLLLPLLLPPKLPTPEPELEPEPFPPPELPLPLLPPPGSPPKPVGAGAEEQAATSTPATRTESAEREPMR